MLETIDASGTSPTRFLNRDSFADVPLSSNGKESNTVLASIWSLSQLQRAELDTNQTMKLLDLVKRTVIGKHRTRMALESVASTDDLRRVVTRNGAAAATMEIRTQEWFDEHGRLTPHPWTPSNRSDLTYFVLQATVLIMSTLKNQRCLRQERADSHVVSSMKGML